MDWIVILIISHFPEYLWFFISERFINITYFYFSDMLYWLNYIFNAEPLRSVYENRQISCFIEDFVNDYILLNYQWRGEGFCWIDVSIKYHKKIFEKWDGRADCIIVPYYNDEILEPEFAQYVNGTIGELITIYKFHNLSKESNIILVSYMLTHELSHMKRKDRNIPSPFSETFCEAIVETLCFDIYRQMLNSIDKIKNKEIKKAMITAKNIQKEDRKVYIPAESSVYEISSQYHEEIMLLNELVSLIYEKSGINKEEIRKKLTKAYLTNDITLINNLLSDAFGDSVFLLCPLLNNDASFKEVKESINSLKEQLKNQ